MKLKDWDEEEEKGRKPQKRGGRMAVSDSGDVDLEDAGADDRGFGNPDAEAKGLKDDGDLEAGYRETLRRGHRGAGRKGQQNGDMDQEEELAPLPAWAKALIFIGLAVLAAILCAVLWHFVHPDKPEEEDRNSLAGTLEASEDSSGQLQDLPSGAEGESAVASEPGAEATTDSEVSAAPDDGVTADSGTVSDMAAPDDTPKASDAQSAGQPEPSQNQSAGQTESPRPTTGSEPEEGIGAETKEPPAGHGAMTFVAVQESVTPKDAVNLRTAPDTADEGNIVVKIQNGETLSRIGVNNDTGWSQIAYDGQTLYAVSQYLTTDLDYRPPVVPSNPNRVTTAGGSVVIFENCDDWITPKEYVNLRTEPSTVQEDATVSCQLNYGEKAHRTGFSPDFGWSRVEYNGQVLYVVTSFVNQVPAE